MPLVVGFILKVGNISCDFFLYTRRVFKVSIVFKLCHYITSDRVYICLRDFKMPPLIENSTDCEVRAVIRFFSTKGFKAANIHRQISDVYGENIMSGAEMG